VTEILQVHLISIFNNWVRLSSLNFVGYKQLYGSFSGCVMG